MPHPMHSDMKVPHYCIDSVIGLTCLLSILCLVEGCSSTHPATGVHFPITSGFHTLLPAEQQRILLLGDLHSTRVAGEWLRSHRYAQVLIGSQAPGTRSDHQAALARAAELNAEFVLVVERQETQEGTLLESRCDARFNTSVDVRGLSVERNETVLRGRAQYPQCVERSNQIIQNLTCQALATAWGFRPSGQLEIPSHMACTTGQTAPILSHSVLHLALQGIGARG